MVVCCEVGGTECSSACIGLLKEFAIIFITSTIVWPKVNNRGGTQSHPSEQDPVSPLVSLSYQEASINLLSFSIRGKTD